MFKKILLFFSLIYNSLSVNKPQVDIVYNSINTWKVYQNFEITGDDIINIKTDSIAYTTTELLTNKSKIYVDFDKFYYSPNTLYNVLLHEIGHYIGKSHSKDPKSIMNYSIRLYNNLVLNDNLRLLSKTDICN